jgi:hypothetical protein
MTANSEDRGLVAVGSRSGIGRDRAADVAAVRWQRRSVGSDQARVAKRSQRNEDS